ncbi:MAG: hypothetical protein AABW72_02960 [archaeon]
MNEVGLIEVKHHFPSWAVTEEALRLNTREGQCIGIEVMPSQMAQFEQVSSMAQGEKNAFMKRQNSHFRFFYRAWQWCIRNNRRIVSLDSDELTEKMLTVRTEKNSLEARAGRLFAKQGKLQDNPPEKVVRYNKLIRERDLLRHNSNILPQKSPKQERISSRLQEIYTQLRRLEPAERRHRSRLSDVSSVQQKLRSEAMQKLFEAHQIMVLERDKHMLDRMLSAGVHVAVLGYPHGITMEREKFYGRKIMFKNIVRGKDIFHAGPVFFTIGLEEENSQQVQKGCA